MTDVRFLKDKEGSIYYPVAHRDYIEDLVIPDNLENLDKIESDVGSAKLDISNLKSAINNLVKDTGWINIPLSSTVQAYSTAQSPKARMITIKNNIKFLSIRGAVKDVSAGEIIGSLPVSMLSSITESTEFVQSMHATDGFSNFNRWTLLTTGEIKLQYSTTTITSTQWVSIDTTLML